MISKLFRKTGSFNFLKRNPELRIRLLIWITLCAIIIVVSTPNFIKLFKYQKPSISLPVLSDRSIIGVPIPDVCICVFETAIEKVTIDYQMADNNIASDYIFMNGTASNSTRVKFNFREEYPIPCLLFQRSNDPRLIYKPLGIKSIRIRFWRNLIRQTPLKARIIGFFYTTYVEIDINPGFKTFEIMDGGLYKFTFNAIEKIDVEGNSHWYQNFENKTPQLSPGNNTLLCEIRYSLINFLSWGIIQKYLLESSPDAKKNRKKTESKYGDISHNLSSTSALQNDTFVDIPYFQVNRLPSHSPLSELNNNSMLGVDIMSHSNERWKMTPSFAAQMDEIEVLKRKVKLLSQLLSKKYLQGFNSETYSALNEPTK
ncbi:hypothetical protein G9A89_013814 [Geosiphon pyriformis]|nr:hypothetical protein G9A89_013814 [Geosiphon pyriformis]